MDMELKEKFNELWKKYFNNAELPITFYYTDEEGHAELAKPESTPRCVIGALSKVRKGRSFYFNAESSAALAGNDTLVFLKK